eukprot:8213850-Pyramimonas_sp.AAC.1
MNINMTIQEEVGNVHTGGVKFEDLVALVLAIAAIWSIGKFGGLFGLPPMCGELIGGVILGPQVSEPSKEKVASSRLEYARFVGKAIRLPRRKRRLLSRIASVAGGLTQLADFIPQPAALQLLGELGLALFMVDAGRSTHLLRATSTHARNHSPHGTTLR